MFTLLVSIIAAALAWYAGNALGWPEFATVSLVVATVFFVTIGSLLMEVTGGGYRRFGGNRKGRR